MNACCILASSNLAANSFRSNCSLHSTLRARRIVWKNSTLRCRTEFRLPAAWPRGSFSWRLNAPRSLAISAALAADFSTSISEARQGWSAPSCSTQRGVAENARERVVEIQRDRSRQLQRAIELLFLRQAGIVGVHGLGVGPPWSPRCCSSRRHCGSRRHSPTLRQQLKNKLLAVSA